MTNLDIVAAHIEKTGSISIREAMDDYSMSGGSLTKYVSMLRRSGNKIEKVWKIHPITKRRYARYYSQNALYNVKI
jgi:hypothetical protein